VKFPLLQRVRKDGAALRAEWRRPALSARRKALLLTLISLFGWSVWNGFRHFEHPWSDLSRGQFTDHFSHMNAARIFPRMGLDIWRVPIADRYRRLISQELDRLPEDIRVGASGTGGVFDVPSWPKNKPLAISWSNKTRMYPPGDMLLVAPIALLYHFTDLSFRDACRLLIGWFIVLTHVALFCFFLAYFEGKGTGIDWLICFFAYTQAMYWTLEGFYDAVAIVPLIVCLRFMAQRRGLAAGVAYCVGALLHFRVFFQAPWAIWALAIMVREKFWKRFGVREAIAVTFAVGCAGVSLFVFWLDWASLANVVVNNPLRHGSALENRALIWNFKVLLLACGVAFLWARAWFDLVSLAWLGLVALNLREAYYWHFLISSAWLVAPARREMARGVRLAFLMSVVAILFTSDMAAPNWFRLLYHDLKVVP